MVNHINEEGLKNIEEGKEVVLVDFYATWCPPCQKLAPILEDISNTRKYKISSINVDENLAVASKYGIDTIPTLIVFKNGEVVDRKVGLLDKNKIIEMLDNHMQD